MDENVVTVQNDENILAGIVGAVLFSLAGGILWFLLYQVGFLAGISGLVGVICAIKGYTIFSKKESLRGIIIAIVSAVVVMIIAWYLCLAYDVFNAYKDWYANGEIDFTITFSEAVKGAYLYLQEPDILLAYLKDLGIGLALCVVGAFRFVSNAVKSIKNENSGAEELPIIETQE